MSRTVRSHESESTKNVPLGIYLREDILEKLIDKCWEARMSKTQYIKKLVEEDLVKDLMKK